MEAELTALDTAGAEAGALLFEQQFVSSHPRPIRLHQDNQPASP